MNKDMLQEELERSIERLSKARTVREIKYLQAKIKYLKEMLSS